MRLSGVSRSVVGAVGVLASLAGIQSASAVTRYNIVELGSLYSGYGVETVAYGINNAGQVVGGSNYDPGGGPYDNRYHAFLLSDGAMTDLGTLGGRTAWPTTSTAGGR